jgi:hypothetical protein
MTRRLALATPLLLAALGCFGPEYLEPEQGGRPYLLQGEYRSEAPGARALGAQVVARGGGRYDAALYRGGLPGAGAEPAPPARASGSDDGSAVRFSGAFSAVLEDGALRVDDAEGTAALLRRVERASPTLGAPPPPGARVLFGGDELSAFAEGKLDPRGFLAAGARTRDAFGSFTLHVEFRTPFMPEASGQGRGNSGVYLQDRYEIQVLDSFGLPPADDECGGIYGQKAPDLNVSLPPLAWQTYDIDFEAARFDAGGAKTEPARVTVRHNGVVIHDAVALAGPTGRGEPEGPTPGPLVFQDHWDPVVYRNLWLVPR